MMAHRLWGRNLPLMPVTNARLADVLYGASERHKDQKARSLRRAARSALMWREEAYRIVEEGRSLTELPNVGPWIERIILEVFEEPPDTDDGGRFRTGFSTMSEAESILADHPDRLADLRGDLQMHSVHSDGGATIGEMAAAAVERGYAYIAMTDHSKGLRIARGMDEERLLAQVTEVNEVNANLADAKAGLIVLRSIELNFDKRGDGDMDPDVLDALDIVVGSFHSQLRKSDDQTDRALGAVRNPHVQIIGHPTGRMFGRRAGVLADWARVFEEGARRGKAFEINAQPNRQDLGIDLLTVAAETDVMFSIGTDAHSVPELDYVKLSLAAAVAAGIPKERIINYLEPDDLRAWVAESRAAARR